MSFTMETFPFLSVILAYTKISRSLEPDEPRRESIMIDSVENYLEEQDVKLK